MAATSRIVPAQCGRDARGPYLRPVRTAGVSPASRPPTSDDVRWHSRGYLPHVDAPHLVQHVIFRLADSLPAGTRNEIRRIKAESSVGAIDAMLDQGHGARHLADPGLALLVQNAVLNFDGARYAAITWCIMPNHVHVLLQVKPGNSLDRVVHSWKSYTAKTANRLLGRAGPFWAPEYFDRFMRDEDHLARTAAYIEANPVKASLCNIVSDWRFSSAWLAEGGRDARGPEDRPSGHASAPCSGGY
jgi:REP element-mobilizing transposase RayT